MSSRPNPLNDVAHQSPGQNLRLPLQAVGLEGVQTQIQFGGHLMAAKATAKVSLVDKDSRGIHMSRLFKVMNQLHKQELSLPWLTNCLEEMLASHGSLSDSGELEVQMELPLLRSALISGEQGWRHYPVSYGVKLHGKQRECRIKTKVLYSSTCPCSAALSRQAIQEKFRSDFPEEALSSTQVVEWLGQENSITAVPHAQRSEAQCEFVLDPRSTNVSVISLIDQMEAALGTAVQAAVKREDEMEFARLNAKNLMFCEDAARKLKAAFLGATDVQDFHIEVRHFESLHPHDVVAVARKFD